MPASRDDLLAACDSAISRAMAGVRRSFPLSRADAEDFAQDLRLRLLQMAADDLARLEEPGAAERFFARAAHNLLVDRMRRRHGHYRPSLHARRMGPIAVEFERLTIRDGLTAEQAVQTLASGRSLAPREVINRIRARLAAIGHRPMRMEISLEDHPKLMSVIADRSRAANPEHKAMDEEDSRIHEMIRRAWALLDPAEQQLLARRFASPSNGDRPRRRKWTAPRGRLFKVLDELRAIFASVGIGREQIAELQRRARLDLGLRGLDIDSRPVQRRGD